MAKKWPFIVVYGLIALGIILGSFYDLQINLAVYSSRNGFGVFMAAIGECTSYICLGFLGGMLLSLELKNDRVLWRKILVIVVGIAVTVFGIYYSSKAIISRNAYNVESWWYLGYPLGIVLVGGAYVGGYFFARKCDDTHWQRDLLSMIGAIMAALIIVTVVKQLNPRPRFRWLMGETDVTYLGDLSYFHNWWDSAASLKAEVLAVDPGIAEEFRSFPSGHVTSAFCALITFGYLPRLHTSWMKHQNWFFFGALAWALLEAYSRLLIGAHYLSDVSFAALVTTTCFLVMDLLVYRVHKKEPAVVKAE